MSRAPYTDSLERIYTRNSQMDARLTSDLEQVKETLRCSEYMESGHNSSMQ
jgi:hypothetical protein